MTQPPLRLIVSNIILPQHQKSGRSYMILSVSIYYKLSIMMDKFAELLVRKEAAMGIAYTCEKDL